ncbi:MAG: pilin [Patescibacteria group bacterium]
MASDGKTPTWVGTDPNGTCSQPCPSPYTGYSYCGASQGQPYQGTSGAPVTLDNPLPDAGTPQVLIGKVISAALGLVGSLALAMFIFGGFMWMTAMGNADKVKKGRDTMIWAALGLVIIFTAYALITFVLTNVLGAK